MKCGRVSTTLCRAARALSRQTSLWTNSLVLFKAANSDGIRLARRNKCIRAALQLRHSEEGSWGHEEKPSASWACYIPVAHSVQNTACVFYTTWCQQCWHIGSYHRMSSNDWTCARCQDCAQSTAALWRETLRDAENAPVLHMAVTLATAAQLVMIRANSSQEHWASLCGSKGLLWPCFSTGNCTLLPKHRDSTKEDHHQATCLKVTATVHFPVRSIFSQVYFHAPSMSSWEAQRSARHSPFLL